MEIFLASVITVIILIVAIRLLDDYRCSNTPYSSPKAPPCPIIYTQPTRNEQVNEGKEYHLPDPPPEDFINKLCEYIESNYQPSWDSREIQTFKFNYNGKSIEVFGENMLYINNELVYHGIKNSLNMLWVVRQKGKDKYVDKLMREVFDK